MSGQSRTELAPIAAQLQTPLADLIRSPAAARVGRLAQTAGLFLFDYEARVQLELPDAWLPVGRPDLGVSGRAPTWERGVLGESKYLAFRHEVLLGSLHPGHRAKWSAHELCHGLVGFAWRPDGSMLFHALAARLAEALPVALWYFFDEAGLNRCERHRRQRELGPSYCAACEVAASEPGDEPRQDDASDADESDWIARGRDFLQRELDGVRRSIDRGRPVATPHGAIDLMTDGLAYAAAHAPRLRSPEHQSALAHAYDGAASGWFDQLEPFMAHIEALGRYVAGDGPAPAIAYRRARLVAQDLALRMIQIAADCDGECFAALSALVARLGADHDVAAAITAYAALHAEFELPPPAEVFAVGYPLAGDHGLGLSQLEAGLVSAMPLTMARLGDGARERVRRFANDRTPSRRPLARRFAAFLAAEPEPIPGLAKLEAAIAGAAPPDPIELGLGLDGALAETLRLPTGVELVRPGFDAGGLLMHGAAAAGGPRSFLVRRDAADEVGLVALSEGLAERLAAGPLDAAFVVDAAQRDPELRALLEEGLLVPDRWDLAQ